MSSTPAGDPEALALIQAGDLKGALARYERLAKGSSQVDHWRLEAADTALRAGDGGYARKAAGTIDPKELSTSDRDRLMLLESRLDLNEGDARSALSHLNSLTDSSLTEADRRNYRLLRSSALNQLGDMKGAARERVALGALLIKPQDVTRNDEAIFESLSRLPAAELKLAPKDDPDFIGWLALTQLIESTPKADRRKALLAWREAYPNHPVSSDFLNKHLGKKANDAVTTAGRQGPFIGVLLPLNGTYAKAAEAIRIGIDAAYQADDRETKPRLEYIDSTQGRIGAKVTELQNNGAIGFIGPLVKDELTEVLSLSDLHVPVVALNQVSGTVSGPVIELGLTPEPEMDQVAGEIWAEGLRAVAILIPETPFGQRLGQHFDATWRRLGGSVIGQVSFTPHGERLGELGRELPAMPKDGAVVLIADPDDARAILPNLSVATEVPVWAPGKAYDGRAELPANASLHHLNFCDMPFILAPESGGPLSAQTLVPKVPVDTPDGSRLVALGLDGYRLFANAKTLQKPGESLEGATGVLRIGTDRKVTRQLTCARFDKALPIIQGLAPKP